MCTTPRQFVIAFLTSGAVIGQPAVTWAQAVPTANSSSIGQTHAHPPVDVGTSPRLCWEEHPCVRVGVVRVDFTALIQTESWRSDEAYPASEEIEVRDIARQRLGVTATVSRLVRARVEADVADKSRVWRDRYIDVSPFEALQVRAGTFFLPFGQDATTAQEARSFALHTQGSTLLAPGRDTGLMVHGTVVGGRVGYELGRFDHDGRNIYPKDVARVLAGRTTAGRVTARLGASPATPLGEFQLSAAFTTAEIPEGLPSLNARTALDTVYYTSNVYVNGRQRRAGAALAWQASRCHAAAEYLELREERRGESVEDTDLSPLAGRSWSAEGACTLVGHAAPMKGPSGRTMWPSGRVGLIEAAARFEQLRFGSLATGDDVSTSPRSDIVPDNGSRLVTLGVNWHVNRWVRLQINAIREQFTHPESGPWTDRSQSWSRVVRLQFLL